MALFLLHFITVYLDARINISFDRPWSSSSICASGLILRHVNRLTRILCGIFLLKKFEELSNLKTTARPDSVKLSQTGTCSRYSNMAYLLFLIKRQYAEHLITWRYTFIIISISLLLSLIDRNINWRGSVWITANKCAQILHYLSIRTRRSLRAQRKQFCSSNGGSFLEKDEHYDR